MGLRHADEGTLLRVSLRQANGYDRRLRIGLREGYAGHVREQISFSSMVTEWKRPPPLPKDRQGQASALASARLQFWQLRVMAGAWLFVGTLCVSP